MPIGANRCQLADHPVVCDPAAIRRYCYCSASDELSPGLDSQNPILMSKPTKNFIELNKLNLLNKNLANLHLTKRMPTAPDRKIVANKLDTKADLKDLKKPKSQTSSTPKKTRNSSRLNRTKMDVRFEDERDMAMTSAGYALYIAIKRQQLR